MVIKTIKYLLACTYLILTYSCDNSKDDDCTKTITVNNVYFVNNQSYYYETTMEVPCDTPDPEPIEVNAPILENFTYEIISFNYTPDTGNDTSRLQFEIKLNNLNNFPVEGIAVLTIKSDNVEYTSSNYYASNATNHCYSIDANSSCTLTFDKEESLIYGSASTMEIINVEYYLTNQ